MLSVWSISQQPCLPDYSASFVSRLVYTDFSPSSLGFTEFDIMFVFVLIILLWWGLTTYVFPESWNQKIDFSWLKWHVWLIAVMTYLVVEALAGFWIYEYQGDPMAGFCRVHGADHVEIPGWLWSLASNAPLVAVLTIVMLIWHVRSIREAKVENRWKSDLELTVAGQERCFENCRLMVIVLPALFGTAAVWSLMRIWEVLFDMHGAQDLIVEYVSLIRSTLVLAEGVEFVAIAAFVQMCLTCIMQKEEHSKDLVFGRPPVWWLAQTGVLSVVVVGMFRQGLSLCQLRTSSKLFNEILEDPTFSTFVTSMLASTGTLFDFVTLLCVVNMIVICKMDAVTEKVKNANLKFTGARMIVIVANIQEKALMPEVQATPEATIAEWGKTKLSPLDLDGYGCALLHVSLLTFECFFITAFHAVTWSEFFENITSSSSNNNNSNQESDNNQE